MSAYTKPKQIVNEQTLQGNWDQLKGKLKQQYGHLTDDDLTYQEGKEDELFGRIGEKIGQAKDAVREMIAKL